MSTGDRWLDHRAGPVVRPYALTAGRTSPSAGPVLDLITLVAASGGPPSARALEGLAPEHQQILRLCAEAITLADIASAIALPVGVARILVGDLMEAGLVEIYQRAPGPEQPSTDLLREVLDGLRAL